ncbi:hypothetical protein Gbro_0162 [Gordonia bronchialis DSM 43247]|uniref:Uncharacterized protein n=1 Tax=Gordonia bronchialis (strain ATCC 25592 / DSM 43247 / BCRC 13721 / JCM 3198 / KCTC 3076 / NBRC 16047 / NCTC 10667) TaxID=526226 RepID=D0LB79_GORB4|nr:hypothetical protein [Gordonia bronchialis]ACY19510.1 hypothetical protein Gbro_0162 [Gordonia bronchialis DSM 43247]MCC3322290.1 hypothetical protein [Gordonia bronchialis]UAK37063.1 hypothetical protein K8O93_18035 [Gordonia bronchialis]STQ62268.1 Uncharacterised protein [Gordonia bronchialis]
MATHASSDLRSVVRRPTPGRVAYDVGARCRAIGISIAVLLIVFVILALI